MDAKVMASSVTLSETALRSNDSVPDTFRLPKYVAQNYQRFFQLDDRPGCEEDFCILIHINRLCVFTFAPSHPVVRLRKTVTKVDFQLADGTDRTQSKGQGYHKKGAHSLSKGSTLCRVSCSDGSEYAMKVQFSGKLLEVNQNLTGDMISRDPFVEGYIAIIFPSALELDSVKSTLLDENAYKTARSLALSS